MDLSTFFKKFDLFADAPDAVAKLRELILELAATGDAARRARPRVTGPLCRRAHPGQPPVPLPPVLRHPRADLRKSILTLAVQGKLVPQDPNDEPALALLDQIAAHKTALARDGKLRGSTTVKPMADDEAEFDLPSNWSWVRFGEIMVNRDGERIPVSKEERETKAKTV